jgi:prophage maintenance system killer protein
MAKMFHIGVYMETLQLSEDRAKLQLQLDELLYGSVEIRESSGNRFIYLHGRENGLPFTKYAGEYTDELYNLILNNNNKAKEIKKSLRRIVKELNAKDFIPKELTEEIKRNSDFARKHLAEAVYSQAVLEGIATTYIDTETIIEGGKVSGMTAPDVLKILNLKHAWDYILNENIITIDTNFNTLCDINKFIEEGFHYGAGQIRSVPVSIGGTAWKPTLPIKQVIIEELDEILHSDLDTIDKAVELLLYIMKRQIFIDGNKRTAVIFANHLIISKGLGLIAIPEQFVVQYKEMLISYYENNDNKIKNFIKENCYIKI